MMEKSFLIVGVFSLEIRDVKKKDKNESIKTLFFEITFFSRL